MPVCSLEQTYFIISSRFSLQLSFEPYTFKLTISIMSERPQDTTTRLSTGDTVRQTSENASKAAPITADQIHECSEEELLDLLDQTFRECREKERIGIEYGVDNNHPSFATVLLVRAELKERKNREVSHQCAVLDIHAR